MKRSTKAALLSGLVFPGIGHLYLKRYVPGVILLAGAASAIYYIASVTVSMALEIVGRIQSGGVPLDATAIADLVSRHSSGIEQSTSLASYALLACWVVGIVDSYRQGRALEKDEKAPRRD